MPYLLNKQLFFNFYSNQRLPVDRVRSEKVGIYFLKGYNIDTMNSVLRILIVTNDKKLKDVLHFCFDGWRYEVFFEKSAEPDISRIIKLSPDIVVVDVQCATDSRCEICNALKNDFATAYIPIIVLISKKQLRQRLLNFRQEVDDYLISPPDPLELRTRIEMAVKRSRQSFYASPLTGLPGGIVIEELLRKKLKSGKPFVVGHVDIDNFKSFNDKYGYIKGDRVIMQTAYMISSSVRAHGGKNNFIGHIGGDDFIVITSPEKYNDVCRNFICMFDTIIPFHYSEEDRLKGYIIAKDRTNNVRKLPIMSVTVALVLKNDSKQISNLIKLNERIAEVKQYLKKIPGSKYLADRRVFKKDDNLKVQIFNNHESVKEDYKPLGQILIEKNMVTSEQLDDALKVHWRRGIPLGETLRDLGSITENNLLEALIFQENALSKL